MSRRATASAAAVGLVGLVLTGGGSAAGPWPGLAASLTANGVVYSAHSLGGKTTVTATRGARLLATRQFEGAFGIPAVTLNGDAGGLSVDRKLLVLAPPPNYQALKRETRFLVLRTPSLKLLRTVTLEGDFGYDALSPDGRTLYLLEHRTVSAPDYAVRAYDLERGRLLEEPIVDSRTPDEKMTGFPVARTTSAHGDWVYTLYRKAAGGLFVHALNAKARYAMCVDFAWAGNDQDVWKLRLSLSERDHVLTVVLPGGSTAIRVDTRTLNVLS